MKKSFLMPLSIFLVLFFLFLGGFSSISAESQEQEQIALQNAITRSMVHCYAVEGRYPESLSYLEEHYGIQIDADRYAVFYDIFAENLMPDITVLEQNT